MSSKHIFISFLLCSFLFSFSSTFAYEEIECSSNPAFSDNSCNQCFKGGDKSEGDNIGFLTDNWVNNTDIDKILYKEEQVMPEIINLGGSSIIWSQVPDVENFWEYAPELETIYNSVDDYYLLSPGKTVAWVSSQLGYAFSLDKDLTKNGSDIGLLVYTLFTHNLNDGIIEMDGVEHKECVLYTSGVPKSNEPVPVEPKKLPDTGPKEFILLFFLALILGLMILRGKQKI